MSPPDDGDDEPSDAAPSDASSAGSDEGSPDPTVTTSGDDPADSSPGRSDDADGDTEATSDVDDAGDPTSTGHGCDTGVSDVETGPDPAVDAGRGPDPVSAGDGTDQAGQPRERPVGLDSEPPEERDEGMNWTVFVYDVVNSAAAVLLVGALLFAVSGVWPPMVAVESPSMTPHMETGDLVFVMEETRFPGEGAREGVVTARTGQTTEADYRKFGRQGDVIVYKPDGDSDTTPIIHRAMFWVEEDENWYDKADRQSVGRYDRCGESTDEAMPNCPAPYAGFITKGDANSRYDQVDGLSGPVKPAWVVGTAEVRIPLLGCIRLRSNRCSVGTATLVGATTPGGNATLSAANAAVSATNATGR